MVLKLLIILVIAFVLAALLITLVKKLLKVALFIGVVLILFLVISHFVFPEVDVLQKGKNYILGKTGEIAGDGKDKITAYVVAEGNETLQKVKDAVKDKIQD